MCKIEVNKKMEDDSDMLSLRVSELPGSTRTILSDLLNSPKVIPVDGATELKRDWRGLANRVNISSEVESSISRHNDPTARVLEIWKQDPAATIQLLLEHLETIQRFDVYDDVLEDLRKWWRNRFATSWAAVKHVDQNLLTFDDRPGHEQHYDAFVLYCNEDINIIREMRNELSGFQICGKDVLLPGHSTEVGPVVKLMADRCRYIIIIYSPAFLNSPEAIYKEYAHNISINERSMKLIPVMYRECSDMLPVHLKCIFWLHYNSVMYNFWDKMRQALDPTRTMPVAPLTPNGVRNRSIQPSPQNASPACSVTDHSPTTSMRSVDTQSTAIITNSVVKDVDRITVDVEKPPPTPPTDPPKVKKTKKMAIKMFFIKPFEKKNKNKIESKVVEEIAL